MSGNDEPLLISGAASSPDITPEIAGSKAAQLWRMVQLGLDVPPAFVMPTTLCNAVNARKSAALEKLQRGLAKGIAWLEEMTGRRFGDSRSPLLVSVRSGAAVSMPGMLETILDIGLNDETVHGLIRMSGNPRVAFDSYRRLIQNYADVVDGVPAAKFDQRLNDMMKREGVLTETELDPEALERLSGEFHELTLHIAGRALPDDPYEQLRASATAVYRSWESARAREYRKLNRFGEMSGTAVTVQAMVFGNSGECSGSGVAFSRNPATGANELYIDFLFDAQGEDVVSGRRTPANATQLEARLPQIARQLADGVRRIEREFRYIQDVEFTVENGRLYFLQSRAAKCTPRAALRIAVDMVQEGVIDVATALARLADIDVGMLGIARFTEPAPTIAAAIPASPGVASGRVVFDSRRAKELASTGDPVILVRPDTSTEDVGGVAVSAGVLTAVGGRTAHAAVIARELGKVCLVGCRTLAIDEQRREARIGDAYIRDGDWLSLDGDTGDVTLGKRAIVTAQPPGLAEVERWRAQMTHSPA